jgi:hypothetical protein
MGPAARNDVDNRITAAAGNHPAASAHLVRQVVQSQLGRALTVDAEHQVRQRIELVGVATVLADKNVW